jgi:hypothetical protein
MFPLPKDFTAGLPAQECWQTNPLPVSAPIVFIRITNPTRLTGFETWVSENKEHSTVHNYFILTALEQGVAGLVFFCALYFAMLLQVQKLYHRFQDKFYKTVTLTIGAVLVMIGVVNSLSDMIETDKIGSLFWLCLGMIILLDKKKCRYYGSRHCEERSNLSHG